MVFSTSILRILPNWQCIRGSKLTKLINVVSARLLFWPRCLKTSDFNSLLWYAGTPSSNSLPSAMERDIPNCESRVRLKWALVLFCRPFRVFRQMAETSECVGARGMCLFFPTLPLICHNCHNIKTLEVSRFSRLEGWSGLQGKMQRQEG